MKNLPIGKLSQAFAAASVYQHLPLGSQEHWSLSFLSVTCYGDKALNYEFETKVSPEKSPFFSRSDFWTRPFQQKSPTVTPYRSGRTIDVYSGASSILLDEYFEITNILFRPGTRRNFDRPGTMFKPVLHDTPEYKVEHCVC